MNVFVRGHARALGLAIAKRPFDVYGGMIGAENQASGRLRVTIEVPVGTPA